MVNFFFPMPFARSVLCTSYLMLALQIAADDLENPFGRDVVDLNLDKVRDSRLSPVFVVCLFYLFCFRCNIGSQSPGTYVAD